MEFYEKLQCRKKIFNYINTWINTKLNKTRINQFIQKYDIYQYDKLLDDYCLHLNEGNSFILQHINQNNINNTDLQDIINDLRENDYEQISEKIITKIQKHSA